MHPRLLPIVAVLAGTLASRATEACMEAWNLEPFHFFSADSPATLQPPSSATNGAEPLRTVQRSRLLSAATCTVPGNIPGISFTRSLLSFTAHNECCTVILYTPFIQSLFCFDVRLADLSFDWSTYTHTARTHRSASACVGQLAPSHALISVTLYCDMGTIFTQTRLTVPVVGQPRIRVPGC